MKGAYNKIGIKLLAAVLVGSLGSQLAAAGDWKLSDSFNAELTHVDRSGDSASNGMVLQLSPRVSLKGKGGRSRADISYAPTLSTGTNSTDPETLSHSLRAVGRMEVVKQQFFLGGRASARLVGDSASSGFVDPINVNSDGRQTYTFEVTPEFRHHLNQYADVVSKNSINYVTYSGDNASSNDDSTEYRTNIGVQSGRYFGPLDWSLNVTRTKTKYDDRDDERTSYDLGAGYRLSGQWRVRGNVGYEDNDVESSRSDTDDITWKVGVDWNPNPRTSVQADYGERYLGEVYSASMSHRTRRTNLTLGLTRDISNRRSSQLEFDQAFLVDSNGAILVDPITGDPFVVLIPDLQQVDEDFVNTQLRAGVSVKGRRTNASLSLDISNRDYEVTDLDEDSYGLTFSLSRRLGQGYNGSLRTRITSTDGASGGDSDSYDVRLSLDKQFSPRTSGSLTLFRRERDGSSGTEDYEENRVSVSVTTSFL